MERFDILDYLSGLTNFVFDKSVLKRVAIDNGAWDIQYYNLTEEIRDRCKRDLLETIVYGVYQTANVKNRHGEWEVSVGSQVITAASLESIKSELRRLYKKLGETERLDALEDAGGGMEWVDEGMYC